MAHIISHEYVRCSLKISVLFLFVMTAAVVVQCGGPKSSILQIIFSLWSLEISEGILRNQKIFIDVDSFFNQGLVYLVSFGLY